MGNLRSVEKAFELLGQPVVVSSRPEDIAQATKLVVPGVGAFGDAMAELAQRGLVDPIREFASSGRAVLGVCLGMQAFFESSEEAPGITGLALLPGAVRRFARTGLKIPHMGWNSLRIRQTSRLLAGLGQNPFVYFVHSYYVAPTADEVAAAYCEYGEQFVAAVEFENVMGTQFHPEKSQTVGLRILANFASLS